MAALPPTIAHMDRRVLFTAGVVAAGVTTWTVPYSVAVDGTEGALVVGFVPSGKLLVSTRPSPTTIAAVGSYGTDSVAIGILYPFVYRLSPIYQRDSNGSAVTAGRLSIRRIIARFDEIADVTATIWLQGGQRYSYVQTNARALRGTLSVPVNGSNINTRIDISSTSAGACALSEIDWEAQYSSRGQRV